MTEDEERLALELAADRARRAALDWTDKGGRAEDLIGALMFYMPTVGLASSLAGLVEEIVAKK